MRLDPLALIDGYKIGHVVQYPEGTTLVNSNWTPRGSRIPNTDGVIFFGLQYFLKEYLQRLWTDEFFMRPREIVLQRYKERLGRYLGPNSVTLDHIAKLHDLGYLPLRFCALPEGTLCPLRVPMLTVENTHPDHAWLVNYMETLMSCVLWKPCTSATTALHLRRILEGAAKATGGSREFVDWQGHDFSMRGMSGVEDAILSGAGHSLFFTGSDTLHVIDFMDDYYYGRESGLIVGSVAATEHSVMCAGGKETELQTVSRLLDIYPSGILSIVSDTWDLWKVITEILPVLKDRIMARDGKIVIRPDSGDPVKIVCGDPDAPVQSPAWYGVVTLLYKLFGGTSNAKGYITLNPHIGVIYGDGIDRERMTQIQFRLAQAGFASDNVVFGIGSYTYELVTRDVFGFAMKATYVEVNGEGRNLWKSPVTDSGEKHSAKGQLAVMRGDGDQLVLVQCASKEQRDASELREVWENGNFRQLSSLAEIRETARKALRVYNMELFDKVRILYPVPRVDRDEWYQTHSIPGPCMRTLTVTPQGVLTEGDEKVLFSGELECFCGPTLPFIDGVLDIAAYLERNF